MPDPRRVLVEVRAPVAGSTAMARSAAMSIGTKLPGFAHDETYPAVPLHSAGRRDMISAMTRPPASVVLRGTLDPAAEAALKKHRDVIAVWSDPPIAPFERAPMPATFLQTTPQSTTGGSTCSPLDCNFTVPK